MMVLKCLPSLLAHHPPEERKDKGWIFRVPGGREGDKGILGEFRAGSGEEHGQLGSLHHQKDSDMG